jgi:CheY-like chemotaxis protein/glycine cleavage system H lipoate-binding protein
VTTRPGGRAPAGDQNEVIAMHAASKGRTEHLTILMVDDEQIVLDSARRLLRKESFALETVLSAAEGLERLERGGVQVVLTDLMMPGMDGLELTKKIKERWPAIPVVMVTGYATISTAMQAMKLGAFDYIAKPFTKEELLGIVKRALHLVAEVEHDTPFGVAAEDASGQAVPDRPGLRTLGRNSWLMMRKDGTVTVGVESAFVEGAGEIRDIDLPAVGDVLSQGAVCLQVFSADLSSHTVWSPLSGDVVEVNEKLVADPATALKDPYGEGWLLRLKPSNFEEERKVLGL